MPKETIGGSNGRSLRDIINGEPYEPPPFVQVGWQRDHCLVQIATLEGGDVDEADEVRSGFFVTLDRHEINRLIRTLRKARDAAFGSDA